MSSAAYYLRRALEWIDALPADVVASLPAMPGFEREEAERAMAEGCSARHAITKDGAACIDPDYYWRDIDQHTPRGVKLQLLGAGGVAIYAIYDGDTFWKKWAPLPKERKQ